MHEVWKAHPVIVTIRNNKDYVRVLLYACHTTIQGWGVLPKYIRICGSFRV